MFNETGCVPGMMESKAQRKIVLDVKEYISEIDDPETYDPEIWIIYC
jgi:hypothetical protein